MMIEAGANSVLNSSPPAINDKSDLFSAAGNELPSETKTTAVTRSLFFPNAK